MFMHTLFMLGQEVPEAKRDQILFWGFLLIGVLIVAFVPLMILRRRMLASEDGEKHPGFSLSELRAMRDRGEITPEEYEQTRARVIAKVKGKLQEGPRKPPVKEEEVEGENTEGNDE